LNTKHIIDVVERTSGKLDDGLLSIFCKIDQVHSRNGSSIAEWMWHQPATEAECVRLCSTWHQTS